MIHDTKPFNQSLDDYHFLHSDSITRLGGVGILIKNNLIFEPIQSFELNSQQCKDI